MSDRDAFRAEQQERRLHGLKARHETREARAVRKAVAEEIVAEADRIACEFMDSATAHRDISHDAATDLKKRTHMATALAFKNKAAGAWAVAEAAREIGSRDPA